MDDITATPHLTTPPEHELPEVLAFWESFDERILDIEVAHDIYPDWDPVLEVIGQLITTLAYRPKLRS